MSLPDSALTCQLLLVNILFSPDFTPCDFYLFFTGQRPEGLPLEGHSGDLSVLVDCIAGYCMWCLPEIF
jgi:hypothetical protein